jgi:hypothetical protein
VDRGGGRLAACHHPLNIEVAAAAGGDIVAP